MIKNIKKQKDDENNQGIKALYPTTQPTKATKQGDKEKLLLKLLAWQAHPQRHQLIYPHVKNSLTKTQTNDLSPQWNSENFKRCHSKRKYKRLCQKIHCPQ